MYDKIIGPTPIGKVEKFPSYAERTAKARKNAGLDAIDQAQEVNSKQDYVVVIDDANDDTNGNLVRGMFVKEDPVGCFSVSKECNFPWQEMVDLDKNDHLSDKGETLGRSKRKITPRMLFP